jgi:hypothetical protein
MMPDDQDFMSGSVRERMLAPAMARSQQERHPWQAQSTSYTVTSGGGVGIARQGTAASVADATARG